MLLAGSSLRMHFGDPQAALLVVYGVLTLALAAMFVTIGLRSRSSCRWSVCRSTGIGFADTGWRRWRRSGVWAVGLTFFYGMPYASGAAARPSWHVTGGQFYWSIVPNRFPVGSRVRFDVTSADVNHGFWIYDPHGHLLGSVQAMPGYHNLLDLTLSTPGTYHVLCFEFCGIDHHLMQSTFEVTGG